ncbi:hypothetical protein [Halomonas heilongjiangensis]|uniref:hypothetical protein n=1 Tax=Halomonas heilongjiangensis TaxID=1387883 RepID=UPI0011AF91AB|nr:hypothetical protein [Halomonas heilongjiangensis]
MSRNKEVEREPNAKVATQSVVQTRSHQRGMRIDDNCLNFLENSADIQTLRDTTKYNKQKEVGVRGKRPKASTVSSEAYKSIEALRLVADHFGLDTVEESHQKILQMIEVLDRLYLMKDKHGTDKVISELKDLL